MSPCDRSSAWYVLDVVPQLPLNLAFLGRDLSSRLPNRLALEDLDARARKGQARAGPYVHVALRGRVTGSQRMPRSLLRHGRAPARLAGSAGGIVPTRDGQALVIGPMFYFPTVPATGFVMYR